MNTNTPKINTCLQYCKEQNGISYCKNCGLTQEMIDELVLTAEKRGQTKVELAVEKVIDKNYTYQNPTSNQLLVNKVLNQVIKALTNLTKE